MSTAKTKNSKRHRPEKNAAGSMYDTFMEPGKGMGGEEARKEAKLAEEPVTDASSYTGTVASINLLNYEKIPFQNDVTGMNWETRISSSVLPVESEGKKIF